MSKATPKTLDQAILNGLSIGLMKDVPDSVYFHVKDFLAQRFGVVFLNCYSEKERQTVEDLWASIIKREK